MKTIEKKYFVCEICGKTSQNETAIRKCQRLHRDISADTEIVQHYKKGAAHPDYIQVTYDDGETAEYYFNCLRQAGNGSWGDEEDKTNE